LFFLKKQQLALGVEAQGPMAWAKKAWTYPYFDVIHKEAHIWNFPIF